MGNLRRTSFGWVGNDGTGFELEMATGVLTLRVTNAGPDSQRVTAQLVPSMAPAQLRQMADAFAEAVRVAVGSAS